MDIMEKAILCILHSIKGMGNKSLWKVQEHFGSFTDCFHANANKLYSSFLEKNVAEEIISLRKSFDPLKYLERLNNDNINTICIQESSYPNILKNIANPPYLLYYRGDIKYAENFCLGMVGSRIATNYGKNTARKLAEEIARQNIVIVSGMARGIDSESHRGALEAGGKTIAVLGSGINIIYPSENRLLYQQIIKAGTVLTEFPVNTPPEPGNFPMRNRIISGLSRGIIVVEAKQKSGALITADFALEQGRDVFAVPGPIYSKTSEGTNNLIKQGAKLVSGIDDILDEYYDINTTRSNGRLYQDNLKLLDSNEILIIQYMGYEACHFDELIEKTGLNIGILSTLLLKLEFDGILKSLPGNYYVRIV